MGLDTHESGNAPGEAQLVTCIRKARVMQTGSVIIPGSDGFTILEET